MAKPSHITKRFLWLDHENIDSYLTRNSTYNTLKFHSLEIVDKRDLLIMTRGGKLPLLSQVTVSCVLRNMRVMQTIIFQ